MPLKIRLPVPATAHAQQSREADAFAIPANNSGPQRMPELAVAAEIEPIVLTTPEPMRVPEEPLKAEADAEIDVPGLPAQVARFVQEHARPAGGEAQDWLEETNRSLRVALRSYSLDVEIVGSRLTPNAALVRLKGTDRMTVGEVEKRRQVLLTSHKLDVIGVRPEKGEVVVMVARDRRAILDLCEAWRRRSFPASTPESNTSFVIGERESDGHLLYLNLGAPFAGQAQHGPHTLIAGETGGGKGILTRNLILDICATNSPAHARIKMIDPKAGGDYPWLGMMPHVDGGLISTQADAIEALKDLVATMDARYSQIVPVASNIDRYNEKVPPEQRLPRIFLFHDELGDWMADKDNADYRQAVDSYVVRLASKARAAGIHLILITQRPDKDALPGQIKANMNNKICLRVSSQVNSRIVLDEPGAEDLLGNGHFVAKLANERLSNVSSLIFGQVPYLDEDEGRELACAIAAHWRS